MLPQVTPTGNSWSFQTRLFIRTVNILQFVAALPLVTYSELENSLHTFKTLLFCKVYFMVKYLQLS